MGLQVSERYVQDDGSESKFIAIAKRIPLFGHQSVAVVDCFVRASQVFNEHAIRPHVNHDMLARDTCFKCEHFGEVSVWWEARRAQTPNEIVALAA